MNKTTVLFPGGFKPLTGAHLALAQRYAEHPDVERVIMLIGPKDRDGITRADTQQIFDLIQMNSSANIEMQPTEFNSPITAAYEYLFALPEDDQGRCLREPLQICRGQTREERRWKETSPVL